MKPHYDIIVVGGGSAGCALAARLSENAARKVLLVEAGRHYRGFEQFPEEMRSVSSLAASMPGYPDGWSFMSSLTPDLSYPIVRGKVVGGSGAINGSLFTRGLVSDYDRWAELGNDQWGAASVLPYLNKLERDLDFGGDAHGSDGPMPVARTPKERFTPVDEAFIAACLAAGYPYEADLNRFGSGTGVGPLPMNSVDGKRVNTAVAYLEPAMDRANLTVMARAEVQRVVIEQGKATGVIVTTEKGTITIGANEIVLSAGGIKTPQLLMLSGIGPAEHLREMGIDVIHDAPAVGSNVKDHPAFRVAYRARSQPKNVDGPLLRTALIYHSGGKDPVAANVAAFSVPIGQALMQQGGSSSLFNGMKQMLRRPLATARAFKGMSLGKFYDEARHRSDLSFACGIGLPRSIGHIRLASGDPFSAPAINYNFMSETIDRQTAVDWLRRAVSLVTSDEYRGIGAELVAPGLKNIDKDSDAEAWIMSHLTAGMHTSCSCRMGPDPVTAVVDQQCRVYGVEGLRIADISVMPEIISRGPHCTAIMIAERVAEFIG